MEPIQIIGISELNSAEKDIVNDLANLYYGKIQRALHNLTSIAIHVKAYDKEGGKRKFSIHVKAIAPTRILQSTKASDWDLARTLHKAFKDLENQIRHVFKDDVSYKKPYA